MRPVVSRHLHIRELDDGSVSLLQVAMLNDALDIDDENRFRSEEAAAAKQRG